MSDHYSQSGPVPLDPKTGVPRKRHHFDPTFNFGHIMQAAILVAAIFSAYSTLDKRLALQEDKAQGIDARVAEQEARMKESLNEIKSDVKEVQRSINDLSRNLTRRAP